MKKLHIYTSLCWLFLLTLSCEDRIPWDLKLEDQEQLVVDGILTNELRIQEIRLTFSHHGLNQPPLPILDAQVSVKANGISYTFTADTANTGIFLSETAFAVDEDRTYELEVVWKQQTYRAISVLAPVAPFVEQVAFQVNQDSSQYSIGSVGQIFDPSQQSMYEVEIDWAHLSPDLPNRARLYFYNFNSLHVNQLIRPRTEEVLFPPGSVVIVRKYGLNDDFADFLRAVLLETTWNGAYYFSTPENVPTNISGDGLGFFTTSAVLADTLVVE